MRRLYYLSHNNEQEISRERISICLLKKARTEELIYRDLRIRTAWICITSVKVKANRLIENRCHIILNNIKKVICTNDLIMP